MKERAILMMPWRTDLTTGDVLLVFNLICFKIYVTKQKLRGGFVFLTQNIIIYLVIFIILTINKPIIYNKLVYMRDDV
jgi:hypothetical protein